MFALTFCTNKDRRYGYTKRTGDTRTVALHPGASYSPPAHLIHKCVITSFLPFPLGAATMDHPLPSRVLCMLLCHASCLHVLPHRIHKPTLWPSSFRLAWHFSISSILLPIYSASLHRTCLISFPKTSSLGFRFYPRLAALPPVSLSRYIQRFLPPHVYISTSVRNLTYLALYVPHLVLCHVVMKKMVLHEHVFWHVSYFYRTYKRNGIKMCRKDFFSITK